MLGRAVVWPRSGLWRHGDFVRLWSARAISDFGNQITVLALPLVAILTLEATAFEVALLVAVQFVPYVLFSIPAGVWVDRTRRRPFLIATDLGRAVLLVSIPVAYGLDALTLPHVYAVAFVAGTLEVVFGIASQAYLPSLLERQQLVEANAKFEATLTGAWAARRRQVVW